jgi:glutaredoxin-like YruB-family protein
MEFPVTSTPKRVVVFTTPTCSWCRTAKKYLTENGVKFKEVDVSRDPAAAREMVDRTGQMGVPVILVGNRAIVGFDRPQIDKALNLGTLKN